MSTLIQVELKDRVQRIRLNRPEKMNAITLPMYQALADALQQADEDPEVRVVYLCAEGDNFCAGNDMAVFLQAAEDDGGSSVQEVLQSPERFLLTLVRMKKPLVIAVKGVAIGIGATMLLHADFVYADTDTRFVLPFINLGLTPEGGCTRLLPQLIGHARAAELLMLGEPFSAQTAAELGMINAVCEPESLQSRAWESAIKLATKPPSALRTIKAALRSQHSQSLETVIRTELEVFAQRFSTAETKEALTAFAAKRAADFSRFS
jgi:enoyl-CoA hydratase/carnithine racemase